MTEVLPTEHQEGRWLMQYCKLKGYLFTHVKNETGRPIRGQRVRNYKAMWDYMDGVRAGFPDFVVIANGKLKIIELKRRKGGKISPAQQEWIDALQAAGIDAAVCRGADEAIAFVEA